MLKCAAIFTDHMVLMRDKEVCVWGQCDGQGNVEVYIDDIQAQATIFDNTWKVYLPAHAAGGPYLMKVKCGSECIEFVDVYYGEVFLAAGQSNMEMVLKDSKGGKDVAKASDYPLIRYYNVFKTGYIDEKIEQEIASVQWQSCVGEVSGEMSAIAYYAARTIYEELQIPVGIVDCYQGGTSISSWLPEDVLQQYSLGQKYITDYKVLVGDKTDEEYEREVEEYWKTWHAWDDKVQALKAMNPNVTWDEIVAEAGDSPWPQPAGNKSIFRPTGAYDSMIRTITPYTLAGIFYYQGETDSDFVETASLYHELMQALIVHWRELFEDESLYFVITQLPMYIDKNVEDNCAWAITRESQLQLSQNMTNVGLLGIVDCGEYGNIHPTDKRTPGERLGNLVLEERYGCNRQGKSMIPLDVYRQDGNVVITCENTYGEILAECMDASVNLYGGLPLAAVFEVAVKDGEYQPCGFMIDHDRIILQTNHLENVERVRYAWTNYASVRIFNRAHIPLVPFGERTVR